MTFTLQTADTKLSSFYMRRLESVFEASFVQIHAENELKICCPLVKFVPAALALGSTDLLLVHVEVILPAPLQLEFAPAGNQIDKVAVFNQFVSSHAFPVLDFLTAVNLEAKTYELADNLEAKTYELADKQRLESVTLDPYRQYVTLGGITYVAPKFEPSATVLYFTAQHNRRIILSCRYYSLSKTFLFHIKWHREAIFSVKSLFTGCPIKIVRIQRMRVGCCGWKPNQSSDFFYVT
jgi:hypothetical protein